MERSIKIVAINRQKSNLVAWASTQAESLLSSMGDRWLHVQGVVSNACRVSSILAYEHRPLLVASAYLHDIGYAPQIRQTGFHPLDGAYYLRKLSYERLACLVAYHSGSAFEAEQRGLVKELKAFSQEHSIIADALDYCDLTTSPTGQKITFQERIEDIFRRYDDTTDVARAIKNALPSLRLTVQRIQRQLDHL